MSYVLWVCFQLLLSVFCLFMWMLVYGKLATVFIKSEHWQALRKKNKPLPFPVGMMYIRMVLKKKTIQNLISIVLCLIIINYNDFNFNFGWRLISLPLPRQDCLSLPLPIDACHRSLRYKLVILKGKMDWEAVFWHKTVLDREDQEICILMIFEKPAQRIG